MPSLIVCPYCRKKCAKCHTTVKSGHSTYVCIDCNKEIGGKCYVCGGSKHGPGTAGATGPGVLCNKCHKINTCLVCGEKINP